MAVRRPTGPLPLGNARPGFQLRPIAFPGAGERPPQSEVAGGTPVGLLPTAFGLTGLKPFLPGRASIKRSFQPFTARRASPFFNDVPAGAEVADTGGFAPQAADSPIPPLEGASPDMRARRKKRKPRRLARPLARKRKLRRIDLNGATRFQPLDPGLRGGGLLATP